MVKYIITILVVNLLVFSFPTIGATNKDPVQLCVEQMISFQKEEKFFDNRVLMEPIYELCSVVFKESAESSKKRCKKIRAALNAGIAVTTFGCGYFGLTLPGAACAGFIAGTAPEVKDWFLEQKLSCKGS